MLILFFPVTAYTTEVTVRRYAVDGVTPVNETTKTYQWMEANLPVYGDGNTYYYYQGPVFENEWEANYGVSFPEYRTDWGGTPPDWLNSSEMWDRYWNGSGYDQREETNWQTKNLGKLRGTRIRDLCDLVGGLPEGQRARIIAVDNVDQVIPYSVLYAPSTALGPYVLTWWSEGAGESGATSGYSGPDYTNGMRATFFADASRNENGEHVAGLGDQAEGLPEDNWYFFGGQYPSMGGWTLKFVDRVSVYSNDPVPAPEAQFSANIRHGHISNGNFETGILSPWTGSAAVVSNTFTYKRDSYSVRLVAPASGTAWIRQEVDLTGVGMIQFWRHFFGGSGRYMEVFVDDTLIANYSETGTLANRFESIDISRYGFTGNHILKFNVMNTNPSGTFTVYLDNCEDFGPGTYGNAPLTIQFTDLSSKMEDPAHTTWSWDFQGDGTIDSTERNPVFSYTANGTYSVRLTTANAGGSDTEIKNGFISVGGVERIPVANFIGSPRSGTAPLTVRFLDWSKNEPEIWNWTFGDRSSVNSTRKNPLHTYTRAGIYTVSLNVTNGAGRNMTVKNRYITVKPPVTALGVFRSGIHMFLMKNRTGTLAVSFGNSTDIPVTGDWNGDGLWDVGVFRPGNSTFLLRNGTTVTAIRYGKSTDIPVSGVWN